MKINVVFQPEYETETITVELSDLNLTKAEWDNLNEFERSWVLTKYGFGIQNQPTWEVANYTIITPHPLTQKRYEN